MDRDPSAAVELYEESLKEYKAAGDEAGRLVPLQNLAANALARGDNQGAITLLREKIANTRGRDNYSLALAIGLLGFALAANGENKEARQSFEESLEMCRVHGFPRAEAEVLSGLADLTRTASPSKALEYYRESIELGWTIEYLPLVAECLRGIAAIALSSGDARDAATLLGVSAGFVGRTGLILIAGSGNIVHNLHAYAWGRHISQGFDWAVRFEEQARACMDAREHAPLVDYEALGNDAFDAAWAEGGGLNLDQAVELALTVRRSSRVEAPWLSSSTPLD